jgi:hypothetical protein
MSRHNISVFGIYHNHAAVERAIEVLREASFRATDIAVLYPENEGTKDFGVEKNTKAPEGCAAGAGAGAVLGGTFACLVGLGLLAIPALAPLVVAGPMVSALAGVGAGGVLGGLIGALAGSGVPEYEAKRYEGLIRRGSILVSVHCDNADWAQRARKIFRDAGAEDIASAGEARGDFARSDRPRPRHASGRFPSPPRAETAEEMEARSREEQRVL